MKPSWETILYLLFIDLSCFSILYKRICFGYIRSQTPALKFQNKPVRSEKLDLVQQYKYLGYCSMNIKNSKYAIIFLLNRMGSLYNVNKNFNYYIFTHLFKTCVSPVIMYGSEACGCNKCE